MSRFKYVMWDVEELNYKLLYYPISRFKYDMWDVEEVNYKLLLSYV